MQAAQLAEALAIAESAATVREAAAALRAHFASLRVVVVDALDMRAETPAAQGTRRKLWFGASDGHCWNVTQDPAAVAGVFIADQG